VLAVSGIFVFVWVSFSSSYNKGVTPGSSNVASCFMNDNLLATWQLSAFVSFADVLAITAISAL